MEITLSTDQLEKLLQLVYLGNWVVNSFRGDERHEESDRVAEQILALAPSKGLKDLVEFDEFEGRYFPSRKLEKDSEDFLVEYEDNVFWNMLVDGLAERDLVKTYGREAVDTMEWNEYNEKMEPLQKKYEKEIDEFGLDRLDVLKVS